MTSAKPIPPDGNRATTLIHESLSHQHLTFAGGARAVALEDELELISAEGHLMARFDMRTGALVLHSTGDLTLATSGELKLRSAKALELDAPTIRQHCKGFELEADHATVETTSWRLQAQRIVERSTDVYRRVERVYETRAETIRSVARNTLSLLANRATLRSREETRVDGKRVLLG